MESTRPVDDWTIRRVLAWTTDHLKKHGSEAPRLESEILLAHARGCRRIQLYTHYEEVLDETVRGRMRELVQRRARHEPVAYLVGHREFYSLDFRVTRDVLIPRPDTETLVMALLELAGPLERPQILEIGTGSGCIAVTAAVNHPRARITATDLSPSALDVARENAVRHGVADRIVFAEGDLFQPAAGAEPVPLIVSNPPYVAADVIDTLDADVRAHEPRLALDGGPGGLALLRRLIAEAPPHLAPGGHLLLECSPEQEQAVLECVAAAGCYESAEVLRDLTGAPRVLRARKGF